MGNLYKWDLYIGAAYNEGDLVIVELEQLPSLWTQLGFGLGPE